MSWDEIIILAESTIHRALAMADQLRRLPPEVLLSITGYCSLVALLALLLSGSAGLALAGVAAGPCRAAGQI